MRLVVPHAIFVSEPGRYIQRDEVVQLSDVFRCSAYVGRRPGDLGPRAGAPARLTLSVTEIALRVARPATVLVGAIGTRSLLWDGGRDHRSTIPSPMIASAVARYLS